MRLLLDTHIAVWAALDSDALTVSERRILGRAATNLVLSAVSVWELRLKWHSLHISGSRKGPLDPAVVIEFAREVDWELLPLTPRHACARLATPIAHKDPFDELLIVQAQEEGMRLLSRDGRLAGHPLVISAADEAG